MPFVNDEDIESEERRLNDLAAALADARGERDAYMKSYEISAQAQREAFAEVERLRAALEHIIECADYEAHGIAREELGIPDNPND